MSRATSVLSSAPEVTLARTRRRLTSTPVRWERVNRLGRRHVLALALLSLVGASVQVGDAHARTLKTSESPEFTLAPDQAIVGSFSGFGGQLNQHVYADISGPPPDLPSLDTKVLALEPQFVRVFFNTTEWTNPDRMASFIRTVELAQHARAQIDITWQGSTFAFARANMGRFADVVAGLLENDNVDSVWVTLFNEPNSTSLTLQQYEQVYRLLDGALRDRGVHERVHFMGGDLLGTVSPLGQSQVDWFTYMAGHMGDLLDAWSVHVYWNFWEPDKIERRLATEVRSIFAAIPASERRPVYVTEFGVRGLPTIEGEKNFEPGVWLDGSPMTQTNAAAFQDGWFMLRATQLGFSGFSEWDLDNAKYDNGTQDFSAIGPGTAGWPIRPVYHLLQLLALATRPGGGSVVDVVAGPGADAAQLVTAYVSPAGNDTILGLDTRGAALDPTSTGPVAYSIGGLPPNTLFHLIAWNGSGAGTNVDYGFIDSGGGGTADFSVPVDGIFALTDAPLGSLPG